MECIDWYQKGNTLFLEGSLDVNEIPRIWAALDVLIRSENSSTLAVNLLQLNNIDSAGVAFLLYLKKRCEEKGIVCKIIGLNKKAQTLLTLYNIPVRLLA